jgi:hypothetical protein
MTNTSVWKAFVALAVVVAVLFSISPRAAAQRDGPDGDMRIVVYLIEASDGVPGIDPEIRDIVKQFQRTFRYSTYRLVSKIPKKIRMGNDEKIALPGLRELRLYARGHEGRRIKLKVKIMEKPMRGRQRQVLDTDFRIVKGGTIVIGGYDYHTGKLIVAISADMGN